MYKVWAVPLWLRYSPYSSSLWPAQDKEPLVWPKLETETSTYRSGCSTTKRPICLVFLWETYIFFYQGGPFCLWELHGLMLYKKRFYTRGRIRGIRVFTIGWNSNPFSWLVKIIEFRKMLIIWLHRKGGGNLKDTQLNTQNAPLNVDLF